MDCKKTILLTLRDNNLSSTLMAVLLSMSLQPKGLENDQKCLGFRDSTPLKSTKFGYKFPPQK